MKRIGGSVGDAFDLELGIFEIEEESSFQAGNVEIAKHPWPSV
jgi:hypothetical protein